MAEGPVLVTGSAGFIGGALVRELRARGVRVVGVDLRASERAPDRAIVGDLTDPSVVRAAFEEIPSAVFHLAAATSVLKSVEDPDGVFRTNVAMTHALLEACRTNGVRSFVLASTNAVVGASEGARIDEASTLRPLTPYGATKAAAEMLLSAYHHAYGMAAASVRLTNVYGPHMQGKDTFVIRLLRAASGGAPAPIYGAGTQLRDYVYVDDAVRGLLLAWERRLAGALVIWSGVSSDVLAVLAAARAATGRDIPTVARAAPAGEMTAVRVDLTYARSLGYAPAVDLETGLARAWSASSRA